MSGTGGFAVPQQQPQPYSPPSGGQIAPGSITYTTSTNADGQVVYHPFRYDRICPVNQLRLDLSISQSGACKASDLDVDELTSLDPIMICSYQTPQGVVTGIQWVPAEATQILPTGAQPANAVSPQSA